MQYSKKAELKKQERLKAIQDTGKIPIEFKFLTIEEIREEDMLISEQVQSVAPRDLLAFSRIEKVMRPGAWSTEGFLSSDEKLYDVYQKDDETLKRLKITYDQVADKLDAIIKFCRNCEWVPEDTGDTCNLHNLKIKRICYLGYQGCPFGCSGELEELGEGYHDLLRKTHSATDFDVTNSVLKESIFFSELHSHLIRDHHFFEGHTKYRLDPEQCIKVLEIS